MLTIVDMFIIIIVITVKIIMIQFAMTRYGRRKADGDANGADGAAARPTFVAADPHCGAQGQTNR